MNWQIVGIVLTATTLIVGASTGYLRLFVKSALADFREALEVKIETKVVSVVDLKLQVVQEKIAHLERSIERLEKTLLKTDRDS